MLLLPLPLGPMMAVTPRSMSIWVFFAKDLNPFSSSLISRNV